MKGQQYEFSCKLRVALSGRHADRFVVTVIDEGDGKQIVVDQSEERMVGLARLWFVIAFCSALVMWGSGGGADEQMGHPTIDV